MTSALDGRTISVTMTKHPEARYGRSGWTWFSQTRYNLAFGVVAVAIGVSAVITHTSGAAVAVGVLFFLAGILLIGTFTRERLRRS